MSDLTQRSHRGNGNGMRHTGDPLQHGKPLSAEARDLQPDAREGQAGPTGVADRPVVPTKPGNAGGGKGPEFKTERPKGHESQEIGVSLTPPDKGSETPGDVACQSEGIARLSLLPAVRQGVPSRRPGIRLSTAAAPTAARRGSTARRSRTSRRTASTDGWTNWRTDLRKKTYRPQPVRRVLHPETGWQAAAAGDRDAPSTLPPHPNPLRDSSPSPIRITRSADRRSRSSSSAEGSIPISSSDSLTGTMPPSP